MKKSISAVLLSTVLFTGLFVAIGLSQTVSAKDSECKVDADKNTCVITAKKGDVEIDKLKITINVQGQSFNSTGLEQQIHNIEDSLANLQDQVNNINTTSNGIDSLEISGENNNDNNTNGDNN